MPYSAGTPLLRICRDCLVKWGLRICSAIILGGVLACVYWLALDRSLPLAVHGGEVIRYNRMPDHSWVMVVRWRGELRRRCGGLSRRWLVDGFRLPLDDFPFPAEPETQPLGPFQWEVPVHVPAYFVATGHNSGIYRVQFFHACNALQELIFPIYNDPPDVPFTIPHEEPVPPPHSARPPRTESK
jgi:hypothetical protein